MGRRSAQSPLLPQALKDQRSLWTTAPIQLQPRQTDSSPTGDMGDQDLPWEPRDRNQVAENECCSGDGAEINYCPVMFDLNLK